MIIPKQMLLSENPLNCLKKRVVVAVVWGWGGVVLQRIQKSKYQLIREGGGQMKEGKVRDEVHAFLLLCLHQLYGPPHHLHHHRHLHLHLHLHHTLFSWQPRLKEKVDDLNHPLRLKLASVTLGATAGKNLSDSARCHLGHYLFCCPPPPS